MSNDETRPGAGFERFRGTRRGEEGKWLIRPIEGLRYQPGEVVPTIGQEFVVRPDGLAIPAKAARPPAPADLIQTFLTGEEVFHRRLGFDYAVAALRRVERSAVLTTSARLMARLEGLNTSHRQVNLDLAQSWFKEPARTQVVREIEKGRALVIPQSLLLSMKLRAPALAC